MRDQLRSTYVVTICLMHCQTVFLCIAMFSLRRSSQSKHIATVALANNSELPQSTDHEPNSSIHILHMLAAHGVLTLVCTRGASESALILQASPALICSVAVLPAEYGSLERLNQIPPSSTNGTISHMTALAALMHPGALGYTLEYTLRFCVVGRASSRHASGYVDPASSIVFKLY